MSHGRVYFRAVFFLASVLTAFSSVAWAANPTNCTAGSATSASCLNSTSISAPNEAQGNPYASIINVSGMTGNVTNVTLVLHGINSTTDLAGVQLLLQGPNGTKLVFLAGDAVGDGGTVLNNATITINDASGTSSTCNGSNPIPASLPATVCGNIETTVINGFPTVCTPYTACPSAQPKGTGPAATMATFHSEPSGNGTWTLFTVNNGGVGNSETYTVTGGWTLNLTTSGVAAAATTTTVSANPTAVTRTPPNPSGASTITATVSSTSTVNGGTVSFFDNGNAVVCGGGNQTVSSGTATCSLTFTQEGIHPITASYGGTSGFAPSTSPGNAPANVTVSNQTTTTNHSTTGGTYCNQGALLIPSSGTTAGPAAPYPSNVFVGSNGGLALPGVITNLTVDLKAIHHTNPNASQLLLVGPSGTPYILFSDAYTSGGSQGPANITLSDAGGSQIPNSGGFSTGTFRPADYHTNASEDEGVFTPPAPQSGFLFPNPIGSGLPAGPSTIGQAFNGAGATGTWSLYVFSNSTGSSGAIDSGWCLNFTVNPNEHATTTTASTAPAASYTASPFTSKFPPAPMNDFVVISSHTTSDIALSAGSVTFTENGNNLTCGNGTMNPATVNGSGNATCNTTFNKEGNHVIKATFHDAGGTFGDSNGNTLERTDSHSTRNPLASTISATNTYNYCNPGQVRLPAFGVAAGPGNPYPSNIFINDLPGTINKVTLSLPDLQTAGGGIMRYLTSLLVGPNNAMTDSIDLFTHVGQLSGFNNPINITLDDSGANGHFTQGADPTSGAWQPTSFGSPSLATYPSLSPAGPYPPPVGTPQYAFSAGSTTFAGVYGSGNANTRLGAGTWSLFQQMILNSNPIFEGNGTNQPGYCLNFLVNPPVVTITKSDQGLHFRQGQTAKMVYTLQVHNSGPGPTGGKISVADTLPIGLTGNVTPGSGTNWTCTGTATVTCTSQDTIAAGADYPLITLSVDVANNAASSPGNPSHMVSNQGSATGGGSNGTVNSNTIMTFVEQVADMVITKVHNGTFTQGDTGDTYTVTASNADLHGPTLGQVMVTDTIPAGLTLTNAAGTGWDCTNFTPPSFVCTRSDVLNSPGSYPAITVTVNVANNAPASVMNTATVSGGGELDTSNDTATDTVSIVQLPDLTISKTHTDPFKQGDTGDTYTLTVHNISLTGPVVAGHTVTVADTMPSGLTLTNAAGTGWGCVVTPPSFSCTRSDTLAVNSSYPAITATVNVATNAPSQVTNTATVAGGGEVITNNDSASDLTNITQLPDLTIAKSHSGNFSQGQQGAQFSLVVTNGGSAATTGTITVTDTLPAGLAFASGTGTGWSCSAIGQNVTCMDTATPIAVNGTSTITLNVNVAKLAPATVSNTAAVACTCTESATNNNSSNTDMVTVTQLPDLTIAKSHAGNFTEGQQGAQFSLVVTNGGSATTDGGTITVTDTLPAGLAFASGTGTGWSCMANGQAVTCTDAATPIASNGTSTITLNVNVAVTAPASLSNTAAVACTCTESATNNNTSNTDMVTVTQLPDLTIAKSHTGNFNQSQQGAQFSLVVTNGGGTATTGTITVTDTLPAGLTFASGTGTGWSCMANGQAVTCTDAANPIAANGTSTITLNVNVAGNAPGTVSNTAAVACTCTESNTNNNTSNTDMVTVTQLPDLTIAKAHVGSNFTQGQQGAQYTLTVTNGGSAATTGTITVTDTLPAGLTFASGTGTGWSCMAVGQAVTCTDSATPIAASGTSGITLNVNVANNAGTPLSNTATVACSCTESNTNNNTSNTDTVTVVAAQLPDLTISKMHVGNFTQGQTGAAYTITVTNSGAGPTSGTVTVSDALPSGLMATAISGTGWTCTQPSGTCTRSDVLAANASYPAITLMVNVAANASSPQTNMATVSGGGETNTANDTASDSTTINTAGTPALGGTLTGKTGVQNARVWSFSITNTGTGSALGAQATSFNLTQTSGAACTPVITSPTFPASLGDIAPAGSATLNVTIDFTGCVNLAKFTLSMPLTANNGAATGSVVRLNEYR